MMLESLENVSSIKRMRDFCASGFLRGNLVDSSLRDLSLMFVTLKILFCYKFVIELDADSKLKNCYFM